MMKTSFQSSTYIKYKNQITIYELIADFVAYNPDKMLLHWH